MFSLLVPSGCRSEAEMEATPKPYQNIGVIGAGAWGTALAAIAASAGRHVTLWALEPDVVESIRSDRRNARFLPQALLPTGIEATGDLAQAAAADALLMASPAQHLRKVLARLPMVAGKPLVVCAKGIERDTGRLMTE